MQEKFARIRGTVYGFAIGDAMGATTEFMNEDEIKKKYGRVDDIIGGGWLNLKAGDVTDDTQMSMCVMKALMDGDYKNFKKDVADRFVKWLAGGPDDVGNQCYKAISYYADFGEYIARDDSALGNGSLMRALPCALLNDDSSIKLNISQGEITHNNEKCAEIIEDYSKFVNTVIEGREIDFPDLNLLSPDGYIVNTYNNVLYWASRESFEECMLGAVNHGGDADTIGAIAGSLAGARFSYSAIPDRWIDKLNPTVRSFLDEFVDFIIKGY